MASKTKKHNENFENFLDSAVSEAESKKTPVAVWFNIISARHQKVAGSLLPSHMVDRADWRKRATAYPDGTVVFHNMD